MNFVYSLSELCSRVLLPPFCSLEFHFVGSLGYSGWLSVERYQDFSWENYFPLWHICALTHRKVETWNWTNVGQKEIDKICRKGKKERLRCLTHTLKWSLDQNGNRAKKLMPLLLLWDLSRFWVIRIHLSPSLSLVFVYPTHQVCPLPPDSEVKIV